MTAFSALEAYDLIRFAEHLQERLAAASASLSQKRGLKAEKEWLVIAEQVLREAREPSQPMLEKVRALPELAEVREEYAGTFQNPWVDLLEKLLAGITFHCGPRDPIIEALFPHQKFPVLRKATRDGVEEYHRDFQRRLKSSYVTRMLAEPAFSFAGPVLEQLAASYEKWMSCFSGATSISEAEAAELRKEASITARRLDLAIRQAKLLAEAALAPVFGAFEEAGLNAKPKKRTVKAARRSDGPSEEPAEAPAAEEPEAVPETAAPAEPPAPPQAEEAAPPAAEPVKPKRRKNAAETPAA